MKLEQALLLQSILNDAINEAHKSGTDNVHIMQRAQAMDDDARAELADAINDAQASK